MAKIKFGKEDFESGNLEKAKEVALSMLKSDCFNYFPVTKNHPSISNFVEFENDQYAVNFFEQMNEVAWEFHVQGILRPSLEGYQANFQHCKLTYFGKEVIKEESLIPYDPNRFFSSIQETGRNCVDEAALSYLKEALDCYNRKCYLPSVLLLGVASESVFLQFCKIIENNLSDPNGKKTLQDKETWSQKLNWLVEIYRQNKKKIVKNEPSLNDLDSSLFSLATLIRKQRNELGHPQEYVIEISRDKAFMFFVLFPGLVSSTESFAEYCIENKL
ncbi:MAG: hypothetical protein HOD92_07940 [Deltaproteobacteria bacterium]|jgi:hypothetical protein|nr:hypothetical protein [Deltaproteobacteria bacterium]